MLSAALQKQDDVRRLGALEDAQHLQLAIQASGSVSFDWNVADDTIVWGGATETLPPHLDHGSASHFLDTIIPDKRAPLVAVLETKAPLPTPFAADIEVADAMGAVAFFIAGTRIPGPGGATERIVGMMRDNTERTREIQRLSYLATRDELTGHLNRNALRAELALAVEQAGAQDRSCAFLVAAIDRLAMINDGYGFDAGEEVIMGVGERLSHCLRGGDVIGRVAGNKFGVILKNCHEGEIALVATRLREAVRAWSIETCGGLIPATCSVGAVWLPAAATTSQEAMLRAEQALDKARARGRDGFAVYQPSPTRQTARLRLMGIADDLMAALRDDRLKLAYQPVVDAASRAVSYYECLLRIVEPNGAITAAGHFVPAAEQMGIVHLIDRFALETVIARLKAYPGVSLAVNVSGTAASDPVWLQSFVDYVQDARDVAARLIVELTETAALHRFEENAHFISRLRALGVRVAIDDFGAGYTSFRNLQMLHVDAVKIDGSYVADLGRSPENQLFVRTLVGLAKGFAIRTVAEWVGSDTDAALLQGFGVDYFQGFHFGEPMLEAEWRRHNAPLQRAATCPTP